MKKKKVVLIMACMMSAYVLAGCGSAGTATTMNTETATEETVTESGTVGETTEAESVAEEVTGGDITEDSTAETAVTEETVAEEVALEDGTYSADFHTDSSMFHVNEANEGKGILTVKDGVMTIHVSLTSRNILNLFPGTAEDAQKSGAELLQPTTDTVTYSDGVTEEVNGFDVPVPALDTEFDLALIGTKGTWYDHKVSVSAPDKVE
ncbi:MAG: hypothetical protein PHE02_07150 [Lachnospiraceae bacterium]|nr:hypothetical protein [Lachnospiraceae bacterium]